MKDLFENIYFGRKVLVTGNTGFKGSWLTTWLISLGANVKGISLPPDTTPNHFNALDLDMDTEFIDIANYEKLNKSIKKFNPEIIFHLAAQPLVRRSYKDTLTTYSSNVMGTVNLFECVKELNNLSAIINVTTDKCYENTEKIEGYSENDKLGGYDPYSASKACSEIITNSFRDSFFNVNSYQKEHSTLICSARAGNVIGGGDWSEDRLIPDIIKSSIKNIPTIIRNPGAIRPWQHVLESITGYLILGQKLLQEKKEFSGAWNFGPQNNEFSTVNEITLKAKAIWPKISIVHEQSKFLHETKILALNSSKSRNKLHWNSVWTIDQTIDKTIHWYREYHENNKVVTYRQLEEYIKRAKTLNYSWT